jgi:pyruvate kinase
MMSLVVKSKTVDTVKCEVIDGGELKSRRHLNVRGKSATLPSITGNNPLNHTNENFTHWLTSSVDAVFFFFFCTIIATFIDKDWEDIKFGVENKIDFYAVSFVKDAEVVHELKDFLKGNLS